MRRSQTLSATLPALAAVALLALTGCGSESRGEAGSGADPTPDATASTPSAQLSTPSSAPPSCPEPSETVRVLGIGNATARVDLTAQPVGTRDQLEKFTAQLAAGDPRLAELVGDLPRDCGREPVLAVVALSCDEPRVELAAGEPWRFVAHTGKSEKQCLVPTTWFAAAAVPPPA